MLTVRDHQTGHLFDPWSHLGLKRRKLLENSWAGVFRQYLLVHLPVQELAPHFCEDFGRPSKDMFMVLGALILQQLHDLTDKQTVEAVAFNISWHYALDIRNADDAYICERTLRNYRRLVIEKDLDQVVFRTLTDRLITTVGVDTRKQRIDSTALRSAMRNLTRLGILVETTSKFLRELKRVYPQLHIDPELWRKYVDRKGEGCFAHTAPSESKRRLPEAARDVYALITHFHRSEAATLDSFQLLEQIFDEQCDVNEDAGDPVVIKPPKQIGCNNIHSPADPDASYNKHRGVGYLIQVMETYDDRPIDQNTSGEEEKPDLITHVAVGKMNVYDGSAVQPALEDTQGRGVGPESLLGDTHYGSNEVIEKAKNRGVEVIAPSMSAKGKQQGLLTLEDFALDEQGRMLQCPQGHAPVSTHVSSCRLQATFDRSICSGCALRKQCPATASRKHLRWQYTHERVRQRARRLEEQTSGFRDRYRWRAGIEGTMSRMKHQMGMGKLRVRGKSAISYVTFLRALGLNIFRVATWKE